MIAAAIILPSLFHAAAAIIAATLFTPDTFSLLLIDITRHAAAPRRYAMLRLRVT